jgi:predicted ABC-type ATPase
MTFNKTVIILRGVSGNGKSTFTEFLGYTSIESPCICTADDFFMKDGVYKFDPSRLGAAHIECQQKFKKACFEGVSLVVCANTNTRESDVNTYKKTAEEFGYVVFVMTLENWHGKSNVHNVPEAALDKQRAQLMGSIKL